MGFLRAHLGADRVAGATGGLNNNVLYHILGAFRRETELHEKTWNVFLIVRCCRIFLRYDGVEFTLAVLATWTKTVVPDIKRLERASEARFDQFRDRRNERRSKYLLQHRFHARFWNLAVFIEAPCD